MKHSQLHNWSGFPGTPLAALGAGLLLALPVAFAGDVVSETVTETVTEDDFADDSVGNYIDVVIGGVAIGGRDAAFKRRFGGPEDDFYGGIEDFYYEQFTDDGVFKLEGHALYGLEDYELKLRYDWDDIGFVRFEFDHFRTWYDGSGGYLPQVAPPNNWILPDRDELTIDRGRIGFEAGLRMPDVPQVTFGYWHIWRDGMKDSTAWGRLDRASQSPNRQGIIPSYWDIDETTDLFTLDLLHSLPAGSDAEITLGGGFRYQRTRSDNTRVENNQKGAADPEDDVVISQREDYELDLYNAHLFGEYRLAEKAIASLGYSFTSLDTNTGGGRTGLDGLGQIRNEHAYVDQMGGAQATIHVANANLWWAPFEDLAVIPSFRAEFWDQSANAFVGEPNTGRGSVFDPTDPTQLDSYIFASSYSYEKFTEQLELRYSGVPDILLYAKGQMSQSSGDLYRWEQVFDPMGVQTEFDSRRNDVDLDEERITLGANWYPLRNVSFSGQYYYKQYEQKFRNHVFVGGEDAQVLNHESDTHDLNLRVTLRAMPNLTFVSRYDYQQTDIENLGFPATPATMLGQVTSADIERHIFSESVTWVPLDNLYIQGSFHYIESTTDTDSDNTPGFGSTIVPDWTNDYWMLNLNAGYTIDDRTSLQFGYMYYEADNFVDNSDVGTPYGTEAQEHAFTVRLNREIKPGMLWNLAYGYYDSEDDAYGGNRDYDAHVLSTGLRYSF